MTDQQPVDQPGTVASDTSSDEMATARVPTARLKPRQRLSVLWLAPFIVLALAAWLAFQAWGTRGMEITIELDAGHGLKAGDEIRFQGTLVGEVANIKLTDSLDHVVVTGRLKKSASHLARCCRKSCCLLPRRPI